jgi:uncharacterized protein DUF4232
VEPPTQSKAWPTCRSKEVKPRLADETAPGNGKSGLQVTLTNISGGTCQTQGWLGVSIEDARVDGGKVHSLKVVRLGRAQTIVLRPAGSAYAIVARTDAEDQSAGGGSCEGQVDLAIVMPGDTEEHFVGSNANYPICTGQAEVTALSGHPGA